VTNQELSWSGQQDLNLRPDIDSIAGDSDRGSETVPYAGQTSGVILTDIAFGLTPPYRLQRRRAKSWRMPPNTISVTRPGRWGNPFDWRQGVEIGGRGWAKGAAVDLFRQWIFIPNMHPNKPAPPTIQEINAALRGKHLACWCAPGEPCHGDLLLMIANAGAIWA
jgi:hypothetical protein